MLLNVKGAADASACIIAKGREIEIVTRPGLHTDELIEMSIAERRQSRCDVRRQDVLQRGKPRYLRNGERVSGPLAHIGTV